MHLVRTPHAVVLLDCGLFQGRRQESFERNRKLPIDAKAVSACVLSHAHIDHSGALPLLARNGYSGPIYATPATRDLCAVMLEDAAAIQAADARYVNKRIQRDRVDMRSVEPLYEQRDVIHVLSEMICVPYHRQQTIAPGVQLTFHDAGHVLGSAVVVLDIDDRGKTKRLVFTGDLGRKNMPILRDPETVKGASFLISESTYGDRMHAPIEQMDDDLAAVIERTHKRGGKVVIPSFALERAQEIIFHLKKLEGRLPHMPVYVDSPLTVKITDVFKMHPECYDEETYALIKGKNSPFDLGDLRYVSEVDDSKAIDAEATPSVIISASGMCEAGRVLHHLQATVEDPKNTVMLVGYQAQHTLGRRILERRPRVKIFGLERDLRAEVVVMNGFSAHADQRDLLEYASLLRDTGSLSGLALVHGEPSAQSVLKQKLSEAGLPNVAVPAPGDKIQIS
jgi:metallo-beta-lactamase family protein